MDQIDLAWLEENEEKQRRFLKHSLQTAPLSKSYQQSVIIPCNDLSANPQNVPRTARVQALQSATGLLNMDLQCW